jgi:agmatinase
MSAEGSGGTFLGLDEQWSEFDRSRVVIVPVPYERTTSYGKGTALGPQAILDASCFVELYDEELDSEIFRLSEGIATLRSLSFPDECRDADAVELIRKKVSSLIAAGKTVACIGGEHTIAVGAASSHADSFPDLSVLQLDAHSDLRDEYEGSRYSHASAMARIHETRAHIVQAGIRSQCKEEAEFIKEKNITTFYAFDLKSGRYGSDRYAWHDAIIDTLRQNVYLTFDCDFLDPSLMPAVGTPEPGGFGWDETIVFLRKLAARRNVVGFDVNELAPISSLVHPQFTIAKLIYKLIGYMFSK